MRRDILDDGFTSDKRRRVKVTGYYTRKDAEMFKKNGRGEIKFPTIMREVNDKDEQGWPIFDAGNGRSISSIYLEFEYID